MAVAFRQVWPTAAGTMDDADVGDRTFMISVGHLGGGGAFVYWTDTGTNAGSSLSTSAMVWVHVSDDTDRTSLGNVSCCGPKLDNQDQADPGKRDQYMFRTEVISGLLRTTIFNTGEDTAASSGGGGAGRQFYAYILAEL